MSFVTGGRRKRNASGRRRSRGAVIAGAALALLGCPATAAANEFPISACQADRINFSTQAFEDFATRGMLWRRACNPEGPGLRGLVTANVVRPGRVERGARSIFILRAPPGTRFTRFTWSGDAARTDCRYALHLWAYRPDGSTTAIKNVRANRRCVPRPGKTQIAGWPRPRTYDVSGATSIVQRIVCVGAPGKPHCSSRERNYIRTLTARATVADVSPPTVRIVADNPFTRGQWVRGAQSVTYQASDNVGVKVARAVMGAQPRGEHPRECDYARRIPCTNGAGAVPVDTTRLSDGSQSLTIHALDGAGNLGTSVPITVRTDNTAPGAVPVQVLGGEGWRNQNNFDLAWSNPNEGDRAPISAAHYRVCRAGGVECTTNVSSALGIDRIAALAVPGPGEWQVRMWREDAATNRQPENASVPVTMRFDPEPPQLGFEPLTASDPTLISVLVDDKVSGVASGQIELSRRGSNSWQALATQRHGNRLVARIDDAALPAGPYLLRATARDQASNQNSTDKLLDGRPMAITLPLRRPIMLRAGVERKRTVRRTVGRGEKRRKVRRRVTALEPRARLELGDRIRVRGRLETANGQPISAADVQVHWSNAGAADQQLGAVRTDEEGGFSYVTPASASGVLRFVYSGTPLLLPVQTQVNLLVRAGSTIRATPRKVLNGRTVSFSGRLRSLPAPPAGKLVELQVVLSGRWQTFRTTRTNADGHWRVRYRFRRTCGLTRYRFRARLPAEAAYPFVSGRTRAVGVRVRGGSCP
jgi:5-hydroxyisourate hydrolase-like protein (transthyretin family)